MNIKNNKYPNTELYGAYILFQNYCYQFLVS